MKLCFAVLLLLPLTVMAQDPLPTPVLMIESGNSVSFYALVADNQLEQVGQLPGKFSIDSSREVLWQLRDWLGVNFTVSPDGQRIAFTAHDQEDKTGFFIYTLGDVEVEPRFVADFVPFATRLEWSPDGEVVMLEPIGCDCGPYKHPFPETYIYEIATDSWRALTNTPEHVEYDFAWATDSRSIAYDGHSAGMYLIDREGNNRRLIVDALTQFSPDAYPATCHFVWSEAVQRWYYEQGCLRRIDNPRDSIYSVNLEGDNRLELALPAYLREEFQFSEGMDSFLYVDVVALEDTPAGLYAFVDTQVYVAEGDQSFWHVIRINGPGQAVTAFEVSAVRDLHTPLFSPDFQHIALVGYYTLVVADLATQQVVAQIELDDFTNSARWLDAHRLLHSDGIEVLLLDIGERSTTNLTSDIDQPAWLLPQTSSG